MLWVEESDQRTARFSCGFTWGSIHYFLVLFWEKQPNDWDLSPWLSMILYYPHWYSDVFSQYVPRFLSHICFLYIYTYTYTYVCVFVNFPWISHYLAIAIRRWPASCSASASPWATRCKSRGISFDVPWTYMGAWFSCLEALRNRWWPMKHDETPWYIWGDELWHIPAILVRKSKCN